MRGCQSRGRAAACRVCDGLSTVRQGPALRSTPVLAAVMGLADPCWLQALSPRVEVSARIPTV